MLSSLSATRPLSQVSIILPPFAKKSITILRYSTVYGASYTSKGFRDQEGRIRDNTIRLSRSHRSASKRHLLTVHTLVQAPNLQER